jgi:hypothetical protein
MNMAPFSGLFEGEGGVTYANTPKSDSLPPQARGIIRTFMQRSAMYGHVAALGRNTIAGRAAVDAARATIAVPGTFNYANRTTARDVNITNAAPAYSNQTMRRPVNATETDMAKTYDTTRRTIGMPADGADNGVTGPAITASTATV